MWSSVQCCTPLAAIKSGVLVLLNPGEKRLARTLLLARDGQANPHRTLPKISRETLTEVIGTTRSRMSNGHTNGCIKEVLGVVQKQGSLSSIPRAL